MIPKRTFFYKVLQLFGAILFGGAIIVIEATKFVFYITFRQIRKRFLLSRWRPLEDEDSYWPGSRVTGPHESLMVFIIEKELRQNYRVKDLLGENIELYDKKKHGSITYCPKPVAISNLVDKHQLHHKMEFSVIGSLHKAADVDVEICQQKGDLKSEKETWIIFELTVQPRNKSNGYERTSSVTGKKYTIIDNSNPKVYDKQSTVINSPSKHKEKYSPGSYIDVPFERKRY